MNQGTTHNPEQPLPQQGLSEHQPSVTQHSEHLDTSKSHATSDGTHTGTDHVAPKPSSTPTSDAPHNGNPLGIPTTSTHAAQAPPTNTEKSTSTTSDAPHNDNPFGIPTTSTHAAQAPTNDKDKPAVKPAVPTKELPATPLTAGSGADVPQSTPSSSATMPANPPAKTHKSLKLKFKEWREKRKSGSSGSEGSSTVHPKDTRTGKELPSEEELSKMIRGPGGYDAPDAAAPALVKDPSDATGKSITGSDANPSKASNPFHAPTPAMHQAPVDAKAQ